MISIQQGFLKIWNDYLDTQTLYQYKQGTCLTDPNEQIMEYTGEVSYIQAPPKYITLLRQKKNGKIWLIFQYMRISTLISPK